MRLHHVEVACPPGGEAEARRFYAEGVGMTEVEEAGFEVDSSQRESFASHQRFHTFDAHGNRVEVLAPV